MLLLAAVVGCVQVQDRAVILSNERSTIERTYELTKYLDHQLKESKDTYVSLALLRLRFRVFMFVCVFFPLVTRLCDPPTTTTTTHMQKFVFLCGVFPLMFV